ncbi:ParB N-terminal domain-containing protein [Actinomadura sp. BRA 177]|nr:ParB N-terminal domain-containing protein [Actinomadura sp. BRA 177]
MISSLQFGYSPRRFVDEEHVHRLAQTECALPPITVHRSTMQVIDGVHRSRAAVLRGRRHIEVVYFEGSGEDAFLQAVTANISHGLPLSLPERKAAAMRIVSTHPHLSDRAIARHAGLAAKTVAALRERSTDESAQSNARLGVDGRVRPLSGEEGRRRAAEVITERPHAPIREIAKVAGVSVGTAHDVRGRMRRGEDPVRPQSRGGAVPDDPVDVSPLLRRLVLDPAMRHTEAGRKLLHLLHTRSVPVPDWSQLVGGVPSHCSPAVAAIAQQNAENWQRLARLLSEGELR